MYYVITFNLHPTLNEVLRGGVKMIRFSYSNKDTKDEEGRGLSARDGPYLGATRQVCNHTNGGYHLARRITWRATFSPEHHTKQLRIIPDGNI
jgi:hypothetical protein